MDLAAEKIRMAAHRLGRRPPCLQGSGRALKAAAQLPAQAEGGGSSQQGQGRRHGTGWRLKGGCCVHISRKGVKCI